MTPEYVLVYERFKAVVGAMQRRGLWSREGLNGLGPVLEGAGDNWMLVGFLKVMTTVFEEVLSRPPPEDALFMGELMDRLAPMLRDHADFMLRHLHGRDSRPS